MVNRWTMLMVFVATAMSVPGSHASDPERVDRPSVQPGDQWRYRAMDWRTDQMKIMARLTVAFASDSVIQTIVRDAGQTQELDSTYTAEWNFLSTHVGDIFVPHSGHLKFPLVVGATYDSAYELQKPKEGSFRMKATRKVTVTGWETVSVFAGTFRTLRLDSETRYERLDAWVSGSVKETLWYSPQVKRWVKRTREDSRLPGQRHMEELVDYKVQ